MQTKIHTFVGNGGTATYATDMAGQLANAFLADKPTAYVINVQTLLEYTGPNNDPHWYHIISVAYLEQAS